MERTTNYEWQSCTTEAVVLSPCHRLANRAFPLLSPALPPVHQCKYACMYISMSDIDLFDGCASERGREEQRERERQIARWRNQRIFAHKAGWCESRRQSEVLSSLGLAPYTGLRKENHRQVKEASERKWRKVAEEKKCVSVYGG